MGQQLSRSEFTVKGDKFTTVCNTFFLSLLKKPSYHNTFRYRNLTANIFELPMAKGKTISIADIPDPKWITPTDPKII